MDQGTEEREEVTSDAEKPEEAPWGTKWRIWYLKTKDKLLREEASMEAQIRMIRRLTLQMPKPESGKKTSFGYYTNLSNLGTWIWANLKMIRQLLLIANKHERQLTENEMGLAKLTSIVDRLEADFAEYEEPLKFLKKFMAEREAEEKWKAENR